MALTAKEREELDTLGQSGFKTKRWLESEFKRLSSPLFKEVSGSQISERTKKRLTGLLSDFGLENLGFSNEDFNPRQFLPGQKKIIDAVSDLGGQFKQAQEQLISGSGLESTFVKTEEFHKALMDAPGQGQLRLSQRSKNSSILGV